MSNKARLTLAGLATASAMRYDGAIGHVIRPALIAERLAELVGLTASEREAIRLVTPVHDVGKLAIPDAVLLKPGQLDTQERAVMERHSDFGADIISGSTDALLRLASRVTRHHHEHYDGTGYPQGLSGDELPLAVRVVAVADAFDAMTEARCYRAGMPGEAACEVLLAGRGTHFDPAVVTAFLAGYAEIRLARRDAERWLGAGSELDIVSAFYGLR